MGNKTSKSSPDQVIMPSPAPVVFLDRDGTINVDQGYGYRIEDWEFTVAAEISLHALQQAGNVLTIATNQSGIAKGLFTLRDVELLHAHVLSRLEEFSVRLAAIAVCPHSASDRCECRKPKIGMAKMIEQQVGPIDYARSWTIGDKPSDVAFGKALGTRTALIRSAYWNDAFGDDTPDIVADNLADAVQLILQMGMGD